MLERIIVRLIVTVFFSLPLTLAEATLFWSKHPGEHLPFWAFALVFGIESFAVFILLLPVFRAIERDIAREEVKERGKHYA